MTESHPGTAKSTRAYRVLCIASLLIMSLTLAPDDPAFWWVVVLAVGFLSVVTLWTSGPILLLLSVGLACFARENAGIGHGLLHPTDFLLAAAALTFFGAHYRLRTMSPEASRAEGDHRSMSHALSRDPATVPPHEIGRLILTAAGCTLAAQLGWWILPLNDRWFNFAPPVWRALVIAWCLFFLICLPLSLTAYGRWRGMTPHEARLSLIDVLWNETRGEQRASARWLAWHRLRRRERSGTQT
jgi:hypothetical protein